MDGRATLNWRQCSVAENILHETFFSVANPYVGERIREACLAKQRRLKYTSLFMYSRGCKFYT
jgi:hypothetical protein